MAHDHIPEDGWKHSGVRVVPGDQLDPAAATGDDRLARIAQVLGRDFRDNAIEIDAERPRLRGPGLHAPGARFLVPAHQDAPLALR